MSTAPATLAEVYASHEYWSARRDRARARKRGAERTIEQCDKHLWVSAMVEQVAALLKPHFSGYWLEVLGPFGLANETAIHVIDPKIEDRRCAANVVGSLSFRPVYEDEYTTRRMRLRLVDRSRNSGQYRTGTIGAMNGLNYAEVDAPDTIEELAALLRASMERRPS